MSKIIILVLANLISTGLAQDISAGACATPSDYDGSHEFDPGSGQKRTCATQAAMSGITATKQCSDVKDQAGGYTSMKQLTNQMATFGCCGSTEKSACWEDISAAVCFTPSDYDGNHEYSAGSGHKTKCSGVAASLGLTSTTKQCTSDKKAMTDMFATIYGCCGSSKKSACWEDVSAAVCLTPSDYDGSLEFMQPSGQKMTCDTYASMAGITATKQCSATVKDGGYMSWKQSTDYMANVYGCCGSAGKSACWVDVSAAICATPSNYDGAHEYGPPGSSSSQKVKCDAVMSQVTLTSTDATCDSTPGPNQGGQPGPSKDYITTILASVYGCCGVGGKSPCSMDTAIAGAVCENAGDFKPDYDVGQGSTCFMAAMMSQITKKDCAANKDSVMGMATMGCCGPARKSACGVAPAAPGEAPPCITDGTVTPWPADVKEPYSQCTCGSGRCFALGTCDSTASTPEARCTCEPSETQWCYASKEDGQIRETMSVKYGCFDGFQGDGSVRAGCAEMGDDILITRFNNAGCKEGDEIESTDDQENPEIISAEWEAEIAVQSGSSDTCTADELTTMSECATKMLDRSSEAADKTKMCAYYQELFACYPACYCNDAAYQSTIADSIKIAEDSIASMDITCSLSCGNTGGGRRMLLGKERISAILAGTTQRKSLAGRILAGTSERKSISTCFNGQMYSVEELNSLNAANTLSSVSWSVVATLVGLIALM